jgi:hypothetical protein
MTFLKHLQDPIGKKDKNQFFKNERTHRCGHINDFNHATRKR